MSYASTDDIQMAAGGEDNLLALADWNVDGEADEDVLARAKAAADGVIDGHLRLRFGLAEIEALRAAPTPTISTIAAAEAVYWMKASRGMASVDDVELRKQRIKDLDLLRAGQFRPADAPTAQRAAFIENDGPITRKGTRGMW